MQISEAWLRELVNPPVSTEELVEQLTMAGLEVESIEKKGKDCVFELEVTPNRADCLSMIGMARELSAILGKNKTLPS